MKEQLSFDFARGDYEETPSGILFPKQGLVVGGVFEHEVIRNGVSLGKFRDANRVVNEGLNHLLNVYFHGATQVTTWYVGIFEASYDPRDIDTAANIAANATESIAYTEANRVEYDEADAGASSQSITNGTGTGATKATFSINDSKTIYGAFLVSSSTKRGTSGTLFSAAKFSTSRIVVSGDQLLVTYTISAASA